MRAIFIGLLIVGFAGNALTANASNLREFSRECEIALSLGAAPKHLWDGAGVYVLGSAGYERVRDAENGFECLLERNHADSVIPLCFDASSTDANLALALAKGRMLRDGKSFVEIDAEVERRLADGTYPIAGHGLVYMISDYNYIYNGGTHVMLKVEPHVMFYAPNLSDRDIGADPGAALANRGLPVINARGPHGFMVSFIEHASDSSQVEAECDGQLPPRTDMVTFPPAAQ